jgi:AcrR family transcriptional regulator
MRREPGETRPDAEVQQPQVVWLRLEAASARARWEIERIVRVAVGIADRDGLAALSMRRLAADLETGTTSLYRYVRSRDELIELMADAVIARDDLPDAPSGDWRADFTLIARGARRQYLQHPWLATLFVTIGPHTLQVADFATAVALRITPDVATAEAIMSTLLQFVRGAAVGELSEREAYRRSGLTRQQFDLAIDPWVRAVVDSGRYPAFSRVAVADADEDLGHEERFEFGLARLLDGIERFLAAADEPAIDR